MSAGITTRCRESHGRILFFLSLFCKRSKGFPHESLWGQCDVLWLRLEPINKKTDNAHPPAGIVRSIQQTTKEI